MTDRGGLPPSFTQWAQPGVPRVRGWTVDLETRRGKSLGGAFNQEKVLVGALSVIIKLCVIFGNLRFKL